ncbi:hypothetical protein DIPPA_08858 [Diplonema papillatum]|nr:hypothetical protein DIPPA_24029 [Diplonema papillatum]KAJ9451250.1 hypothetical protein DIPPA_08858 [Diplonema papillatum]
MAPYVSKRKSGWVNIDTAYQMQLPAVRLAHAHRGGDSDGTWLRRNWGTCKPSHRDLSTEK